ncbi:phosphate ABC transporter substrate-binding protein, PhoT family [[Leptolyngbya] sp. PCC 7376]|uniref:phosphate ABC transporter substrate-binding protein n=1 Tax=[Leptolyngbya] sp. PCC 7376 TaxID=111781 RepID=UPI00029EE5BA|nr:phosphate ABC transporter substrate-binding protein [[Leptolyngbya] sp. PCC 7376]AFY38891.1 phosphate ABC transporter substrate-binding protein, PhoT family [[Leptolyngbya] sp. PCC 7376]
MSQKNDTLPLILALFVTLGILGAGAWFFLKGSDVQVNIGDDDPNTGQVANTSSSNPFSPPGTVNQGTTIRVSGSTSMVKINEALKNRFELQYPGTTVAATASGSSEGIKDVLAGNADVAAVSRPLSAQESSQGLKAIPVASDAIALVVSKENPFSTGLTKEQAQGIFTGSITDWSAIGGSASGTIRVINRPAVSGTHQTFQELVLAGAAFGTGDNFTMMEQDATTPILQALGRDGISYATYGQIANQQTVRTVPVNGVTPESDLYPYLRPLYYVYKEPATPAAEAFLGFAGSPVGMEVIQAAQ